MKMRFLLIGVFLFHCSFAFSKEVQDIYDILRKMKMELQLSDEQVSAIRPIIKENISKRQALLDRASEDAVLNKENLKMEMIKLKEDENLKLSKVLSKEQMKRLVDRQHVRESLNKDQIDFSEGLSSGISLNPQGGAMQF